MKKGGSGTAEREWRRGRRIPGLKPKIAIKIPKKRGAMRKIEGSRGQGGTSQGRIRGKRRGEYRIREERTWRERESPCETREGAQS